MASNLCRELHQYRQVQYLQILANTFTDPQLHLSQVGIDFNETKFATTFDQLIRLHNQLLLHTHKHSGCKSL